MFRSKTAPALALGVAAIALVALSQIAGASHVRPRGASPVRIALVPAEKSCATPNRTHGAPLAFPSCAPPVQASSSVTVGTPDANGAAAFSTGFVLLRVKATSPEDLLLSGTITDVRCLPATDASVCTNPNSADGPDYSGQLQAIAMVRLTDHYNGPGLNEAATVQEFPLPINLVCANTSSTTNGGTCNVDTSQPVVCPECGLKEGQRMVVELGQFRVDDGGPDGLIGTADNTTFMRQGIFIP